MSPSHLVVPVGGQRAGSAEGTRDWRVTATGGWSPTTDPEVKGRVSGVAADLLVVFLGRVRVTLALAVLRAFLVMARGMCGAATALVPLPAATGTQHTDVVQEGGTGLRIAGTA